jgi:hypothetical protein
MNDRYTAAFPIVLPDNVSGAYEDGMTLRDYFAGQVLAGLCADPGVLFDDAPATAYKLADLMMEARQAR